MIIFTIAWTVNADGQKHQIPRIKKDLKQIWFRFYK